VSRGYSLKVQKLSGLKVVECEHLCILSDGKDKGWKGTIGYELQGGILCPVAGYNPAGRPNTPVWGAIVFAPSQTPVGREKEGNGQVNSQA
jgi:hypothetical protein